jgi:hypothetical protein
MHFIKISPERNSRYRFLRHANTQQRDPTLAESAGKHQFKSYSGKIADNKIKVAPVTPTEWIVRSFSAVLVKQVVRVVAAKEAV